VLFVKLLTGYFRDIAIASGTDAMEVMFTRGIATCGETETGGFIPDAIVPSLTRKPAQARKIAQSLVAAGLWEVADRDGVPGFEVRTFLFHNRDLDDLQQRRRSDRERQRRHRKTSRELSRDTSQAMSRDVTALEKEEEKEAAAAAPRAAAGGGKIPFDDLPAPVLRLRDRFAEFTVLNAVRFTDLTPEKLDLLLPLIDRHGVDTLTDFARWRLHRPGLHPHVVRHRAAPRGRRRTEVRDLLPHHQRLQAGQHQARPRRSL
jgi:hypothetical protein